MINDYKICPYCGMEDKPCSEVTNLARAWARDACRKKHDGVSIQEVSIRTSEDLNLDL